MHKITPIAAAGILAIGGLVGLAQAEQSKSNTGSANTSDTSRTSSTSETSNTSTTSTSRTDTMGGGAYGGGPSSYGTSTKSTSGSSYGTSGTKSIGGGPQACPMDEAGKTQAVLSFLHDVNQQEIKEGTLASTRSQDKDVKDFAQMIVKDHQDADKKLTDLASKKGISLARGTPSDPIHAALYNAMDADDATLRGKTGKSFDFAYVGPEANEHSMALKVIDEGEKFSKDNDVKKLLGDLRTGITSHETHAKKLADQLAMTMSEKTTTGIGGGPSTKSTAGTSGTSGSSGSSGSENK